MLTIEPIQKLSTQLSRLPGIGAKTAQRLAYHILDLPESQANELAEAILAAKRDVHFCPVCGTYTDKTPCEICTDETRDPTLLCVVADARDVMSMERTREFFGRYHVLQGVLSPMNGVGPNDIRINELVERVKTGGVKEVILATDPDVEGEATASYIARLLKPMGIACTRIAHGIPIGGNLEYTDEITLAKALEGRRRIL
ncbi:MAG: recombination protein RecR [Clostridia bacterium]|nr:recombination protein RecR [Clostridia bacterium]